MDYKSRVILVTGGTGFFGQSFVKHLLAKGAKAVIVYSRDEYKQYMMQSNIQDSRLFFEIGDVKDLDRLKQVMTSHKVNSVVHASALKHVPVCERNPTEAVKVNVIGAMNVVDACQSLDIDKVVMLSTDKAVYPINAMGCSKFMAEKVFAGSGLNVSIVRYGNVINSRGSLVPKLIEQCKSGEDVYITDTRMTRFLMTIDDAMSLVDTAFFGEKGVYVKKCVSSTVLDLIKAVMSLQSYDKDIKVMGNRGGEKLHETLITYEESFSSIDFDSYVYVPFVHKFSESGFAMSSDNYLISPVAVREFLLSSGVV